jgi:ABC-2 type transport system permease protein
MDSRRRAQRSTSITLVVLLVVILIVVNIFAARHFVRVDLTNEKIYTLSPASRRIAARLDDLLTIEVYLSKKLPPNLVGLRNSIEDLLAEYRAYSGGKIKVKFLDPADDPEMERKLARLGVPRVQMNIIERDQAQVISGYLGMGIFYEDRAEVIPVIESPSMLEYDLSTAIIKVIGEQKPQIGFLLTGSGYDFSVDFEALRSELEKQYEVREVRLERGLGVPDGINTLLIAGVRDLTDWQLYEIDQFIMRGGKTMFMLDPIEIGEGLVATAQEGLPYELLHHYGVDVNRDLVLDTSNEMASFSSGFFSFFVPYPFWVKVRQEGFNPENPVVSRLESLSLPWTSSLDVVAHAQPDVEVVPLAASTPRSWRQVDYFDLNPQQDFASRMPAERESMMLVALLSGSFDSYFSDKEVPTPEERETPPSREPITKSIDTQMIVVGNSRFAVNDFMPRFPTNMVFLLNAVDWFSLSEDLISIRSRTVTDRPLSELTEPQKTAFKVINTYGMAFAIVVFGLARLLMRRREKAMPRA